METMDRPVESSVKNFSELDQIDAALKSTDSAFGDFACYDIRAVVDGYTNPKSLTKVEEERYHLSQRNLIDDVPRIAEILTDFDANDESYNKLNLKGSFFSILEQCGIVLEADE